MSCRKNQAQEDIHFWLLRHIQDKPQASQRDLAKELGISLGSVNYCLQALVAKGLVKMQNFTQSSHKLGYIYILTPEGILEKSSLTGRFLQRKLAEYEMLSVEIERLKSEAKNSPSLLVPA